MTNRRDFLRNAALFSGAGLLSSALPGMSAMAQGAGGYKALVCVFLAGGMDGHDAIIPQDQASYDQYAATRERLLSLYAEEEGSDHSRRRENLRVMGQQADGRSFGMPHQLGPIADHYGNGRLAVIANVGPLEEVTTRADTEAKRAKLPPRLMSHNDQQSMWEALGTEGTVTGWGGRMADAVGDANSPFSAISISGNPTFLAGDRVRPFQMGTGGVRAVHGTGGWAYGSNEVPAALRAHYAASAAGLDNLIASDFQDAQRRAVSATNELAALMKDSAVGEEIKIEGNRLSEQLAVVAKTIALRSQLGLSRQVFFVKMGGFDTHEGQPEKMPKLQAAVAQAMSNFYAWTVSAGVAQDVTTFTASDFGRTLTTNASGSDHGWGGHHFVLGGAVRGGRIIGSVPPSVEKHDQDFGRGRMIPTIATEQYAGALGRWFGLSDSELRDVLPRWDRFEESDVPLFGGGALR